MIAYVIIALLCLIHYTFVYCNKHRMVNPLVSLGIFWFWPVYVSYLVYKWGQGKRNVGC